jgi:uncharacterized protein DUF5666
MIFSLGDRARFAAISSLAGFVMVLQAVPVTLQAQATSAGQTQGSGQGSGAGRGRGMRGMGEFPGGGRGVLGTVTDVASDHYTIKTDAGDIYTVHFSVNTRIIKQLPGQGGGRRSQGTGGSSSSDVGEGDQGTRPQPQTIKPTEIKIGDIITAGGEMDDSGKSLGAVFIALIDPERAKQMREMQANYGKTWLAGRITAIDGTTITIEGLVDHAKHAIEVDENTSFRKRRDSITLADIQPGEQLRAEGAVQGGVFRATTVMAMEARNREQGPGNPNFGPPPTVQTQPK